MVEKNILAKLWLASFCGVYLIGANSYAMGLRSFVALPINQGGVVTRLVVDEVPETNNDQLITNIAYGLDGKQTFFVVAPYRLSSGKGDRLGDIGFLYRNMLWQDIETSQSTRLGLLVGAVAPTDDDRDPKISTGFFITHYNDRHELDIDALWQQGIDDAPNMLRYDISWQYRISPAEYPEWGLSSLWNTVIEFAGRGVEGSTVTQQFAAGLQWVVTPRWALEGGIIQDLNGPDDTNYILSTRFHF